LVTQICHIDQQKAAWLGSDFCVNCAPYITYYKQKDLDANMNNNKSRNLTNAA